MNPQQQYGGLPPGAPPPPTSLFRVPAEAVLAGGFSTFQYPNKYLVLTAHRGGMDSRLAVLLAATEGLWKAGFDLMQIIEAPHNGLLYAILQRRPGA